MNQIAIYCEKLLKSSTEDNFHISDVEVEELIHLLYNVSEDQRMEFYMDLSNVLQEKVDLNSVITQYYRNFIQNKLILLPTIKSDSCAESKVETLAAVVDKESEENSIMQIEQDSNGDGAQDVDAEPFSSTHFDSLPSSKFEDMKSVYRYDYVKDVDAVPESDTETNGCSNPKLDVEFNPLPETDVDMAVDKILALLDEYDINTTYAVRNAPRGGEQGDLGDETCLEDDGSKNAKKSKVSVIVSEKSRKRTKKAVDSAPVEPKVDVDGNVIPVTAVKTNKKRRRPTDKVAEGNGDVDSYPNPRKGKTVKSGNNTPGIGDSKSSHSNSEAGNVSDASDVIQFAGADGTGGGSDKMKQSVSTPAEVKRRRRKPSTPKGSGSNVNKTRAPYTLSNEAVVARPSVAVLQVDYLEVLEKFCTTLKNSCVSVSSCECIRGLLIEVLPNLLAMTSHGAHSNVFESHVCMTPLISPSNSNTVTPVSIDGIVNSNATINPNAIIGLRRFTNYAALESEAMISSDKANLFYIPKQNNHVSDIFEKLNLEKTIPRTMTSMIVQCLTNVRESNMQYDELFNFKYKSFVNYMMQTIATSTYFRGNLEANTKIYELDEDKGDSCNGSSSISPRYVSFSDFPECTDILIKNPFDSNGLCASHFGDIQRELHFESSLLNVTNIECDKTDWVNEKLGWIDSSEANNISGVSITMLKSKSDTVSDALSANTWRDYLLLKSTHLLSLGYNIVVEYKNENNLSTTKSSGTGTDSALALSETEGRIEFIHEILCRNVPSILKTEKHAYSLITSGPHLVLCRDETEAQIWADHLELLSSNRLRDANASIDSQGCVGYNKIISYFGKDAKTLYDRRQSMKADQMYQHRGTTYYVVTTYTQFALDYQLFSDVSMNENWDALILDESIGWMSNIKYYQLQQLILSIKCRFRIVSCRDLLSNTGQQPDLVSMLEVVCPYVTPLLQATVETTLPTSMNASIGRVELVNVEQDVSTNANVTSTPIATVKGMMLDGDERVLDGQQEDGEMEEIDVHRKGYDVKTSVAQLPTSTLSSLSILLAALTITVDMSIIQPSTDTVTGESDQDMRWKLDNASVINGDAVESDDCCASTYISNTYVDVRLDKALYASTGVDSQSNIWQYTPGEGEYSVTAELNPLVLEEDDCCSGDENYYKKLKGGVHTGAVGAAGARRRRRTRKELNEIADSGGADANGEVKQNEGNVAKAAVVSTTAEPARSRRRGFKPIAAVDSHTIAAAAAEAEAAGESIYLVGGMIRRRRKRGPNKTRNGIPVAVKTESVEIPSSDKPDAGTDNAVISETVGNVGDDSVVRDTGGHTDLDRDAMEKDEDFREALADMDSDMNDDNDDDEEEDSACEEDMKDGNDVEVPAKAPSPTPISEKDCAEKKSTGRGDSDDDVIVNSGDKPVDVNGAESVAKEEVVGEATGAVADNDENSSEHVSTSGVAINNSHIARNKRTYEIMQETDLASSTAELEVNKESSKGVHSAAANKSKPRVKSSKKSGSDAATGKEQSTPQRVFLPKFDPLDLKRSFDLEFIKCITKRGGLWQAVIDVPVTGNTGTYLKHRYLGLFTTEEYASKAFAVAHKQRFDELVREFHCVARTDADRADILSILKEICGYREEPEGGTEKNIEGVGVSAGGEGEHAVVAARPAPTVPPLKKLKYSKKVEQNYSCSGLDDSQLLSAISKMYMPCSAWVQDRAIGAWDIPEIPGPGAYAALIGPGHFVASVVSHRTVLGRVCKEASVMAGELFGDKGGGDVEKDQDEKLSNTEVESTTEANIFANVHSSDEAVSGGSMIGLNGHRADIHLSDDHSVDELHAEIVWNKSEKCFFLSCLSQKAGLYINGDYVPSGMPGVPLNTRDIIQIGHRIFYFLLAKPSVNIHAKSTTILNKKVYVNTHMALTVEDYDHEKDVFVAVPSTPSTQRVALYNALLSSILLRLKNGSKDDEEECEYTYAVQDNCLSNIVIAPVLHGVANKAGAGVPLSIPTAATSTPAPTPLQTIPGEQTVHDSTSSDSETPVPPVARSTPIKSWKKVNSDHSANSRSTENTRVNSTSPLPATGTSPIVPLVAYGLLSSPPLVSSSKPSKSSPNRSPDHNTKRMTASPNMKSVDQQLE